MCQLRVNAGLIGKYRCLIPADRFYEWTVGSDGKKQPIHFHLPGYDLFAFAGLWTARTDEATGEIRESCTIITTSPNSLVAPLHDRMPVILGSAAETLWLDPSISKEHALSLLGPYPAELMLAVPASTRVNSVRNDDARLLLPDDAVAARCRDPNNRAACFPALAIVCLGRRVSLGSGVLGLSSRRVISR